MTDEGESRRQLARRQTRSAGDRSARVAHQLMDLSPSAIDKLKLDEDLREVVDRARAVVSNIARRREERSLAGALRRSDLGDLEQRLADLASGAASDLRQLQLAESWRTRLIDGEPVATFVASFANASELTFAKLVADARRERTTGKPRGAARALFRQIVIAIGS